MEDCVTQGVLVFLASLTRDFLRTFSLPISLAKQRTQLVAVCTHGCDFRKSLNILSV